jgi:hypothetical protein
MREKKNINKTILILIVTVLVTYLGFKIVAGFSENAKALGEGLPATYSLSPEHASLISKKYLDKIRVTKVLQSKVRNPISLLSFDSSYSIVICRINLIKHESLESIVNIKLKNIDRSVGYSYNIIGHSAFRFQYKSGEIQPASQIQLTFFGDSLQTTAKSDSLVSFSLLCKNLSIRYGEDDPIDIYVETKSIFLNSAYTPMNILFLERDKKAYLLLMTPNDKKGSISPNKLYDIVMGNNKF